MNYESSWYENTIATLSRKKKLIRTKFKIYIINLEIIWEEKLYIYIYIYLKSKNLKRFCNMMKLIGITTMSKPNFYYITYDIDLVIGHELLRDHSW